MASVIYGLLMNLFLAACEVSNILPTTMTGTVDSTMDNTTTDNGMYCCASKLCVLLFLVSRPNHDKSVSKGNLDRVILYRIVKSTRLSCKEHNTCLGVDSFQVQFLNGMYRNVLKLPKMSTYVQIHLYMYAKRGIAKTWPSVSSSLG